MLGAFVAQLIGAQEQALEGLVLMESNSDGMGTSWSDAIAAEVKLPQTAVCFQSPCERACPVLRDMIAGQMQFFQAAAGRRKDIGNGCDAHVADAVVAEVQPAQRPCSHDRPRNGAGSVVLDGVAVDVQDLELGAGKGIGQRQCSPCTELVLGRAQLREAICRGERPREGGRARFRDPIATQFDRGQWRPLRNQVRHCRGSAVGDAVAGHVEGGELPVVGKRFGQRRNARGTDVVGLHVEALHVFVCAQA
mmetsp:Transcript_64733/g.183703  ORF Transcript_64733/g.183703 Transcript_64733/m.183703 type:complete len:250 (+) Transcript_64733:1053-1802(+)